MLERETAAGTPGTPGTWTQPHGVGVVSPESPHRAAARAGGTKMRGGGGKGRCPHSGSQRKRQTLPTPTKSVLSAGAPEATEALRKREVTRAPHNQVWSFAGRQTVSLVELGPGSCPGSDHAGRSPGPGTMGRLIMTPRNAKRTGHRLARRLSPRVYGLRPLGTCSTPGHMPVAGLGTQPQTVRP